MSNLINRTNPFDLVKASDFSDVQIEKYWVDLAGEAKLYDLFQPTLTMPMLLLGGKGSGKTHLMRYYSSAVRRLKTDGNPMKAAKDDSFLGIYVRADGLNVGRFDAKGESEHTWSAIFSYYFELWLATHFLKAVHECIADQTQDFDEKQFAKGAINLFNKQPDLIPNGLVDLIEYLATLRKAIDHAVSNVATGRTSLKDVEIALSPGELVFGLPELLTRCTGQFDGILFVYMIDEIENFTANQQRFLNSLIRYRRGPVTFKIGCRLYGVSTKKTLGGSEEEIRQGAEYEKVELDAWLRGHETGYYSLAGDLVVRRLEQAGYKINSDAISSYFETLDSTNHYQKPTLELVAKYDARNESRPYFTTLRKHLTENSSTISLNNESIDLIVSSLKINDYPLLEKLNVYLFCKDWNDKENILTIAKRIKSDAEKFLSHGKKASPSYFQALDHFKSDLLAQLYRDCGKRRIVYAGFDTLIHLSQGAPRNLLGLLKHIYRRSQFAGEQPFETNKRISIAAQIEGVRDASAWFWEDAQPDRYGKEARLAVQSLAELFAGVRFSMKPAECDLSTFTISPDTGNNAARQLLMHAENWSYLVKIQSGGTDRNDSASKNDKYQLSPMLAPHWEVSEHRRGAISLNDDIFNALFDNSDRSKLEDLIKERLKKMREPFGSVTQNKLQGKLI
jgi:hypothetical protein